MTDEHDVDFAGGMSRYLPYGTGLSPLTSALLLGRDYPSIPPLPHPSHDPWGRYALFLCRFDSA